VAFQPIVDAVTGRTLAYESLVRSYDALGFPDPGALFDHAQDVRCLLELDQRLINKAIEAAHAMWGDHKAMLFINCDGRLLPQWKNLRSFLEFRVDQLGLDPGDICVELSERHQPLNPEDFAQAVMGLRRPGFRIAMDDFGTGVAGFEMLYQSNPDFIKIDRFFIKSMPRDAKKRLMVSSMVDLAHTLGARVIAEGIETAEELACCRDINCDLLQGYLIARPTSDMAKLLPSYQEVLPSQGDDGSAADTLMVDDLIEDVVTLDETDSLTHVISVLAHARSQTVFPCLDKHGLPVGAVRERDVRALLYSPFGQDLARNQNVSLSLKNYIRPIATLDRRTPLAPRLEMIAERADDGVIVTDALRYRGYLPSSALLKLSNHYRLMEAAAQNPLTGLPGNDAIQDFLKHCVRATEQPRLAAYIDIDNFKPFNDKYGFELGDRGLLMLAAMLRSIAHVDGVFVGHVGGDDFFVGAFGAGCGRARGLLETVCERFSHSAESLYDNEDRERGFLVGRDRHGVMRELPLLNCTVVALELDKGVGAPSTEAISTQLSHMKTKARADKLRVVFDRPCQPLG